MHLHSLTCICIQLHAAAITYVHLLVFTYIYIQVHAFTFIFIHIHVPTFIYFHLHRATTTYVHIQWLTCTYFHVHASTFTYMHLDSRRASTFIYRYIFTHLDIYTLIFNYTYLHSLARICIHLPSCLLWNAIKVFPLKRFFDRRCLIKISGYLSSFGATTKRCPAKWEGPFRYFAWSEKKWDFFPKSEEEYFCVVPINELNLVFAPNPRWDRNQ